MPNKKYRWIYQDTRGNLERFRDSNARKTIDRGALWSNAQVFSSSKPQLHSHIYILHLEFDLFDPVAPPGRAS